MDRRLMVAVLLLVGFCLVAAGAAMAVMLSYADAPPAKLAAPEPSPIPQTGDDIRAAVIGRWHMKGDGSRKLLHWFQASGGTEQPGVYWKLHYPAWSKSPVIQLDFGSDYKGQHIVNCPFNFIDDKDTIEITYMGNTYIIRRIPETYKPE